MVTNRTVLLRETIIGLGRKLCPECPIVFNAECDARKYLLHYCEVESFDTKADPIPTMRNGVPQYWLLQGMSFERDGIILQHYPTFSTTTSRYLFPHRSYQL